MVLNGLRPAAFLILFSVILTFPAIANQGKPALQQTQPPPKIAVTTRLVNVSVVVQDKNGNPVTDLGVNDFTLSDGGHVQRIDLFTAPSPAAQIKPPLNVPPDVYTNLLDAHGDVPPNVTIILLDGLNTAFGDQGYVRQQVLKYLSQIQPQDHVALYTLTSKLRVLHDFTTDATSLINALGLYKGSLSNSQLQAAEIQSAPDTFPGAAQLNTFIAEANSANGAFFLDRRVRMTLEAFTAIAHHAEALPGRKSLIWVSGSFPICFCFTNPDFQRTDLERFYANPTEQVAENLADANIAVYPVDAKGVVGVDLAFAPAANGPAIGMPRVALPNTALMEDLASWTGGRPFYNTNDIMGSIRRAADDSRFTYVLGYYPDHKEWKGEFRKIKVKVDRSGLQVRTREGYFAVPESSGKPKEIQAAIAEIADSPLDATAIGFAVRITPLTAEPLTRATPFVPESSKRIQVTLHFDPHPIQFASRSGRENADIQYAILELDENGKVLTGIDKSAKISVPEAQYQTALKEGMGFDNSLPLLPNANELCVILRDNITGAAGSVHIPLAKYQGRPAAKP